MKPSMFVHYEPTSIDQAIMILADVADHEGRIIAGGQTLVPAMALRLAQPAYLVDINRIEELHTLEVQESHLVIRACVRHAAFHQPVCSGVLGQLLSTVVRHIAHLPIRNRGTFCGSVANADAASEWCLVSTVLEATMRARNLGGQRDIPANEFFLGFMTTALAADELLVEVRIPILPFNTRFGFEEYSRRAGDFAQAMALTVYELHDGLIANARVGVGGVEGAARRLIQAEACLNGQPPQPELFDLAADMAAEAAEPSDVTAKEKAYKRALVRTVVRRSLEKTTNQTSIEASAGETK